MDSSDIALTIIVLSPAIFLLFIYIFNGVSRRIFLSKMNKETSKLISKLSSPERSTDLSLADHDCDIRLSKFILNKKLLEYKWGVLPPYEWTLKNAGLRRDFMKLENKFGYLKQAYLNYPSSKLSQIPIKSKYLIITRKMLEDVLKPIPIVTVEEKSALKESYQISPELLQNNVIIYEVKNAYIRASYVPGNKSMGQFSVYSLLVNGVMVKHPDYLGFGQEAFYTSFTRLALINNCFYLLELGSFNLIEEVNNLTSEKGIKITLSKAK